MKRNPEFWDTLIKRLKAGERPEDLKVELGLGGVVDKYARYAEIRWEPVKPAEPHKKRGKPNMIAFGLRPGEAELEELLDCATPTVDEIQVAVCNYFTVRREDLFNGRSLRAAQARRVGMYLSRQLTSRTFAEIARLFKRKDHTTPMYACRAMETEIESRDDSRLALLSVLRMLPRRDYGVAA